MIAHQLKLHSYFVIGWIFSRRSKFPSHLVCSRMKVYYLAIKLEVIGLSFNKIKSSLCTLNGIHELSQLCALPTRWMRGIDPWQIGLLAWLYSSHSAHLSAGSLHWWWKTRHTSEPTMKRRGAGVEFNLDTRTNNLFYINWAGLTGLWYIRILLINFKTVTAPLQFQVIRRSLPFHAINK